MLPPDAFSPNAMAIATSAVDRIIVDTGNSALDWATAIGTIAAAFGALAAVVITLYVSVWREQRRTPELKLEFSPDAGNGAVYYLDDTPGPAVVHSLNVSNAPGNRSANGVEVLLSAGYWLPPPNGGVRDEEFFVEVISNDPLTFRTGESPKPPGIASAVVPPGVTRKLSFLYSGSHRSIFDATQGVAWDDASVWTRNWFRRNLGAFLTVPLEDVRLLDNHLAWQVRLTVTAQDVDAISYRTQVRWNAEQFGEKTISVRPDFDALTRMTNDDWRPVEMSGEWQGHTSGSLDHDQVLQLVPEREPEPSD